MDKPINILLAEDNPVNQRVATLMLERNGHSVTVVEDGESAVSAWRTGQFDVILMDVMMPKLDGIEATRHIRREEIGSGRRTPIIALTANAMQNDQDSCLAAGMDGYLVKPIKLDQLYQEIERAWQPQARQTANPSAERGEVLVFDHADALERMGGSLDILHSLFDLFLQEQANYAASIEQAMASGNQADLIRAAHTLKGALGTLSANRAQGVAAALELAAKAGEAARYRPLADELKQELAAFTAAIAK